MQIVSRSVTTGSINALAMLILLPQLTRVSWRTYAMVAVGLAIVCGLPCVTHALVALAVLAPVSMALDLPLRTVGDMGSLPQKLSSLALRQVPFAMETLRIVLPYPLTMAAVGLPELLLTAQIVDDLTDADSEKRREWLGQGGASATRWTASRRTRRRVPNSASWRTEPRRKARPAAFNPVIRPCPASSYRERSMKLVILAAAAAGIVATASPPAAEARQGCGPGFHRGPAGVCRPNVRGVYYRGFGYWDGHRYWKARYRYRGGWRYR